MDFVKIGTQKNYFSISEDGKWIVYKNTKIWDRKEKFTDPEEQVRAEFYVDLLEKYQYESKNIWLEVEMPKRVPNQFADLVIYEPWTNKAYFVIEFKKADISDNEFEQAVKQGIGNWRVLDSQYYGTIAWETQRFFEKWKDNSIDDAFYAFPIRYGKPEERTFTKNGTKDIEPITTEWLKTILAKAHQTIWRWGKRNPAEAFGEVAKIIFIKVADEKLLRKDWDPYEFQRKRNESTDRLAKRIHAIYEKEQEKDKQVFNEQIKLDEKELATVVEHLQAVNLNKTDLDVKWQAFQQFLGNFFKWDFGQYFTPTAVTKFCIDMLGNELENHHKVLDPACWSGGFLLQMLDFMRNRADEYFTKDSVSHFNYRHDFAEKKLFGIEISEAIARVAKMNMILHDDWHTNVISHDWLDDIEKMSKYNLWFQPEGFDFIFTNPPFGAVIKETESDYLWTYDLWKNGKNKRTSQKTEILFIERCWQFLKPNGNMAIVLPDGIVTNSSLQYVRDRVLEHFKLKAVISLSQDAFKYYWAWVKSSILILQKREWEPEKDYKIFMAIANKIGIDATGRACENDLIEITKTFKASNETISSKNIFKINLSELEWSFNPERYSGNFKIENSIPLNQVVDIYNDTVKPSTKYKDQIIDWIRIDKMENWWLFNNEGIVSTEWQKVDWIVQFAKEWDILLARLWPSLANKKIMFCPKTKNTTVVSNEFIVMKVKKWHNPIFVLNVLMSDKYISYLLSKWRGWTPSRLRISRDDLEQCLFPNYSLEEQNKISQEILNINNKIDNMKKSIIKEEQTKNEIVNNIL